MKQRTITSDEREYPLSVFPDIMNYAVNELNLRVKVEFETPYGWRGVLPGESLWQEGMRWRISFFHYERYLIPGGLSAVGIIW